MRQRLRQESFSDDVEIDFDKPTINAAFQAMEDWLQANKAAAATAINVATAPYVFSNTEKRQIAAIYFEWRFTEDK